MIKKYSPTTVKNRYVKASDQQDVFIVFLAVPNKEINIKNLSGFMMKFYDKVQEIDDVKTISQCAKNLKYVPNF